MWFSAASKTQLQSFRQQWMTRHDDRGLFWDWVLFWIKKWMRSSTCCHWPWSTCIVHIDWIHAWSKHRKKQIYWPLDHNLDETVRPSARFEFLYHFEDVFRVIKGYMIHSVMHWENIYFEHFVLNPFCSIDPWTWHMGQYRWMNHLNSQPSSCELFLVSSHTFQPSCSCCFSFFL